MLLPMLYPLISARSVEANSLGPDFKGRWINGILRRQRKAMAHEAMFGAEVGGPLVKRVQFMLVVLGIMALLELSVAIMIKGTSMEEELILHLDLLPGTRAVARSVEVGPQLGQLPLAGILYIILESVLRVDRRLGQALPHLSYLSVIAPPVQWVSGALAGLIL